MHLKSLTLKGFTSFASPTTRRFEPGITCVVGPNGSGKSNVVDAMAWVLGEQGAKALRGGKMEDVIFAGTPGRPPLGRAEVTLTIDNTDGALPIEYAEVSVRRLMFRSGESEYSINGARCRLVDVQELMSDSGIGRELHVVVGQGQLDAVLSARPEDRRAFIEEAAGVLKHKKRKEKALRKLEAMQAGLTRLTDLTVELRRQLKPLGRQAEVARRAQQVQADARDARLRLLADDLVTLRAAVEAEVRDETVLRERRAAVEADLVTAQAREAELEAVTAEQAPRLAGAQETWYRLSALQERLRGTATLAAERRRHLTAELPEQSRQGRDPEALDREAAGVRDAEAALGRQLAADAERLRDAVARRTDVEAALATEEKALVAAVRAVADRREGLARLTGQVGALRSRAGAAQAELGRLAAGLAEAAARAARARADLEALQEQVGGLDEGEVGLDERHEAASAALAAAEQALVRLTGQEREAERDRSTWAARRDALALSLRRKDGSAALLAAGLPGVLGTVAALVRVEPGAEAAVAAALGAVADAVAVAGPADAAEALSRLRAEDAGRAGLLVGGGGPADRDDAALPEGARWALDMVDAPVALRPALARMLHGVAVVATLADARELAEAGLRAVTADGDLLGADWAAGGSAGAPSLLEVQAAADEAAARHDEAQRRQERLGFEVAGARAAVQAARGEVDAALAALHDSDARMAALAEQLGMLASQARAADAEAGRLEQARVRAEQARDRDLSGLAELEQRLAAAEAAPTDRDPSPAVRDRLTAEAAAARAGEVEARLAVRTGEERARGLAGRADGLERAAAAERAARERLAAVAARRAEGARAAEQVVLGAELALRSLETSLAAAAADRDEAAAARAGTDAELAGLRGRSRELAAELDRLTDVVHRDEVARAEQRLRIEALEARAAGDWGVPLDRLLAEYGPAVPVPTEQGPVPYDRAVQDRRAAAAERALAQLGRVNPLALEEFAALEERSAFLTAQLEDLKDTRRDLLTVVQEVDDRIHDVFASAFADTAREFVHVFATLFPGGEGRLVLTEPDDLLATGIEVMARPAGKKVSRLSLLSGGERSLTAIALLVAIFRARPSPFYVMDEVEAALDDRNLGRLLELLTGLRESSQLIVITHQKRTMEIADALYGVTMRGDGVSAVVSQRLRERQPA
ncbi:MAG TPA: chromosome segregation protein SMC [Mycobacteriales bacterium]|nr:chromosome segregation protein SMC [Mycobacteriales bacterium]